MATDREKQQRAIDRVHFNDGLERPLCGEASSGSRKSVYKWATVTCHNCLALRP